MSFERFMGLTLRWRSIKEVLGALWNWFNVPQRGHLIDKRVKIPSANLRLHAPHRISSICKPVSLCENSDRLGRTLYRVAGLADLQACSAGWGLAWCYRTGASRPSFFVGAS